MEPVQYLLGAASGALVGFMLGLVGGGGSILAVPLTVYLVGVRDLHTAIGTSALAVAANAATGLANHAIKRTVRWRPGAMFSAAGVAGAFAGSTLGMAVDGRSLLALFALLMIVVGGLMLRRKSPDGQVQAVGEPVDAAKVLGFGLATGALSGLFGIGGGFLIVPGLIASTGMPMINAVGTSLIAVTAFGLTTSVNYAASGHVDWSLAASFIVGGLIGCFGGVRAASRLATDRTLTRIFAVLVFAVAGYMLWRSAVTSA